MSVKATISEIVALVMLVELSKYFSILVLVIIHIVLSVTFTFFLVKKITSPF